MQIQCKCGQFNATLLAFPKRTPGRLKCYCDDCQMYMMHIGRTDLLDAVGGTEVIPAYPSDVRINKGHDVLACTLLSPKGLHRFYTTCCTSPVGNTGAGRAWLGLHRNVYTNKDPQLLDRTLGDVKGSIMGKFAKGPTPPGTPATMNLKAAIPVMPFMIKGALGKKGIPSPFFREDNVTPIAPTKVLTLEERNALRKQWEAQKSYP